MHIIKDIEELFLTLFLTNDKLKIIDNQNIKFLKLFMEILHVTFSHRINKISVKMIDRRIENF